MKNIHRFIISIVLFAIISSGCGAAGPTGSTGRNQPTMPPPPPRPTNTITPTPVLPTPTPDNPVLPPTPTAEPSPTPTPSVLVFAAIGDYGLVSPDTAAVANLVKSWNPELIITMGDNNYPSGKAETIDKNVGQYYSDFIYPYKGEYGPGADINRFFPTLGNHDWDTPDIQPYLDYFELPGNERYYDFIWGPVHFFALDADSREPDGVGVSSIQAQWLQDKLKKSTTPWQIVYMHQPPYSSGHHGSTDYMQWPFAEWGADAVLAGHDHSYERLIIDDIPYIVNGLGGYINRYFFFRKIDGSQFQYRSDYGALRVTADETRLTFEMITVDEEIIDTQTLIKSATTSLETVTALPDPDGYEWHPFAAGFRKPLYITHAGDGSGRLFIVEQAGAIMIHEQETPFLNISDRISTSGSEQGLLGLAFDPDFATNGLFYVNYTARSGNTVISRFNILSEQPNLADPNSEVVLLTISQPFRNHNGGQLAFGPDGLLYAGTGDGGSSNDPDGNAQNPATYLGKMLQIDTDSGEIEIYASGLRNPWRFSFDSLTGELYLGDVGQNKWEEINFLPAGQPAGVNFGWDFYEGFNAFEGSPPEDIEFTTPVHEYSHEEGCSVTGGYVYRGSALPEFYGVYIFGDFCLGTVWGLVRDTEGNWINRALFNAEGSITSFGLDESGEMYLVTQQGIIYSLVQR